LTQGANGCYFSESEKAEVRELIKNTRADQTGNGELLTLKQFLEGEIEKRVQSGITSYALREAA